jgi:hypothetical protein
MSDYKNKSEDREHRKDKMYKHEIKKWTVLSTSSSSSSSLTRIGL